MAVKLSQANQQIKELKFKKAVIKSCVADINADFHGLIETCDSLLTVSVRQHLVEKLKPIYSKTRGRTTNLWCRASSG